MGHQAHELVLVSPLCPSDLAQNLLSSQRHYMHRKRLESSHSAVTSLNGLQEFLEISNRCAVTGNLLLGTWSGPMLVNPTFLGKQDAQVGSEVGSSRSNRVNQTEAFMA